MKKPTESTTPSALPEDDDGFDPNAEDFYDDDGLPEFECGLFHDIAGWTCSKAGSEECDWECPYS